VLHASRLAFSMALMPNNWMAPAVSVTAVRITYCNNSVSVVSSICSGGSHFVSDTVWKRTVMTVSRRRSVVRVRYVRNQGKWRSEDRPSLSQWAAMSPTVSRSYTLSNNSTHSRRCPVIPITTPLQSDISSRSISKDIRSSNNTHRRHTSNNGDACIM